MPIQKTFPHVITLGPYATSMRRNIRFQTEHAAIQINESMGILFFDYRSYKRNLTIFPFCNIIVWNLFNYFTYNIMYVGLQAKQWISDNNMICTFMSS